MSSEREFRGDPIARMPASAYGLSGEYPLLDQQDLWSRYQSPGRLAEEDVVSRWFATFESARLWNHEENVSAGGHIQVVRNAIQKYVARHHLDLVAMFHRQEYHPMDDTLQSYFRDMHDTASRLALGNIRLLYTAFKKVGFSVDDTPPEVVATSFCEGYMGLLSAAKRYDPWLGTPDHVGELEWARSFSTYAVDTAAGYMKRTLHKEGGTIRLPDPGYTQLRVYNEATSYLARQMNRSVLHVEVVVATMFFLKYDRMPSEAEFEDALSQSYKSRNFGRTVERYQRLIESQLIDEMDKDHDRQSKKPFGEETTETVRLDWHEGIADETGDTVGAAEQLIFEDDVDRVLGSLPERERIIIELVYGFYDGNAYTQWEAAQKLGLPLGQVKQIYRRALRKLSGPSAKRVLRGYFDEASS